ncbi:MAG: tetratricopeptide repeat protein [Candidatus Thorarchaeota archaeon]
MSIQLFSPNELESLRTVIEKNGWKIEGKIENYFRYSVKNDKLLLFTLKIPIQLPVRLNIPLEMLTFRLSIAFKFWNLNSTVNRNILLFMKLLRNLALQAKLDQKFPIEGKESQLVELLNLTLPEPIENEHENAWVNRIRISLMNKQDSMTQFSESEITSIIDTLNSAGLQATFKFPWELREGVPRLRSSDTLFFSNDEEFDEFFILEKGFFSYFKDLEYNKIYLRTGFDSYTPYLIKGLLQDTDFSLETSLENWIKLSRMLLNSLLKIINAVKINQQDYIQINSERELDSSEFELNENNFPFTALHYESSIAKGELYHIHNDLLNSPPRSFKVLEFMNTYSKAEELIKNYRFEEATQLLNSSLKVFNKHKQKKIVVSILLKLRKIAENLNQPEIALNYLNTALGVAKSGDVPIDFIIKVHYKLGKYYFKSNAFTEAEQHFETIIKFLEKEEVKINKIEYLGMAYLYRGLINTKTSQLSQSKNDFKEVLIYGKDSTKVKLKYHLLRAKDYKDKGNLSQAQKLLRAGIDAVGLDYNNKEYEQIFINIVLELVEFYIHHRVDSRKALYLLKLIETRVSQNLKQINGIKKAIRWNLLMCDYQDILEKNSDKSTQYYKQSQILINQLKKIGVIQ